MSRLAVVLAALAACSIPETTFKPSPDGGEVVTGVLAINASVSSFDVDEGGRTDFMVTLTQAPSAELVVKVAPGDAVSVAALGISLPELRFQPTNFDKPQTITVTGLPDVDAVDAPATISLTAPGVDTLTLNATVRDHDRVEMFTDIAGNGVLSVNELDSATVRVHLTHKPAADVRVRAMLGTGPVTVAPAERTFTPANYDADQTFTFTAPDDPNIVSEDQSLTLQAVGLPDKAYTIHDIDKDSLNIRATPSTISVAEGGGNQLSVTLTRQPAASTTVHIDLQRGNVGIDHTDLTFTAQNYDQAQMVLVSAPQDLNTANEQDTITLSIPGSTVPSVTVAVSTVDDDVQAILEDAPDPLSATENQNATFGVTLKFQPASTVTVSVTSLDSNVATASPGTLTFTPQNYADPAMHQVTVRGSHDNNLATSATNIRLREPTLVDKLVAVSVADIDKQVIVLSSNALTVPEGSTRTFDVSLMFDPGSTVTVNLADDNATALPIDRTQITFTTQNFATPVRVTVSPPVDRNNVAETATVTVGGAAAPTPATIALAVGDSTVIENWGWLTAFPSTINVPATTVIAYQIEVATNATTLDVFHTHVPSGSGRFRMALYNAIQGPTTKTPSTLVAESAIRFLANGRSDAPSLTSPMLSSGSYFLVIRFENDVNVGRPNGMPDVRATQCIRNFGLPDISMTDWPSNFGAAACTDDTVINMAITTFHQ